MSKELTIVSRPSLASVAPDGTPVKLLSKLQLEVYRRRLRVKDSFEGFDPLRSGHCTTTQFQRAVNRLAPNITPEEGECLADFFTVQGRPGPQAVNYQKFARTLEEVFVPPDLEKNPTKKVPRPGSTMLESTTYGGRGTPEDRATPGLISEGDAVREDASATGPRPGTGTTAPRPGTQGTIMSMSARGPRDFPFFTKRARDSLPSARSTAPTFDVVEPGELSEQVVQKLKEVVRRRSLRVHGAFQDFDPLRRGTCSPTHLRTVLTVLNIALPSAEQDALLRLYSVHGWDRSDFDYRKFCNDVNEQSLYPSAEPPGTGASERLAKPAARPVSRGFALQDTTKLLARVCKHLKDRRHDIKDVFLDAFRQFDPRHSGVITQPQFCRIMSSQGFDLKEQELMSLCLAFTEQSDAGLWFRCQDFLDALGTCMSIHFTSDDKLGRSQTILKTPAGAWSRQSTGTTAAPEDQAPGLEPVLLPAGPPHASTIAYPPTRCSSTATAGAARRRLRAPK